MIFEFAEHTLSITKHRGNFSIKSCVNIVVIESRERQSRKDLHTYENKHRRVIVYKSNNYKSSATWQVQLPPLGRLSLWQCLAKNLRHTNKLCSKVQPKLLPAKLCAGKIHLGAFRRMLGESGTPPWRRMPGGCQVKTFLKPNCHLSSQIIFGHKFCAASATPAKVFLSSGSSVGKKLLSTPPPPSPSPLLPPPGLKHASCAVPSVFLVVVLVQLVTSPLGSSLQSANSSYRTPARRVKCAAASEQLRFDRFAARNENAASRVGDQATSKAGVNAQKLFTPFALCLWHIQLFL